MVMEETVSADPVGEVTGVDIKGKPIEIVVGSDKHSLFVHECLLRQNSAFFDKALSSQWLEGRERVVCLPDDSAADVYIYFQWLYSNELPNDDYGEDTYDLALLGRLYVLGEGLLDDRFQDSVMNAFVADTEVTACAPSENVVSMIYGGTLSTSPARRFLVNTYVALGDSKSVDQDDEGIWAVHQQFKDDLIKALFRKVTGKGRKMRGPNTCSYHKHAAGMPWKSCDARHRN